MTNATEAYNVVCEGCGFVFTPRERSPLWWKAKQRATEGFLDALCVTREECGCIEKRPKLDTANFSVFGYDCMCRDFFFQFKTFTAAVRTYLKLNREGMNMVFITGVSPAMKTRLDLGF